MRRSMALTAAAALLLLAASLAAAYMSIAAYVERIEEVETRRMFRDWMAKVNKTYDSIGEEHRYAVFKENLRRRFDKHGTSVDAARLPNGFGDRTREERRSFKLPTKEELRSYLGKVRWFEEEGESVSS